MSGPGKFYKTVSVAEAPGGFAVRLDDKPLKTPLRADFVLPTELLAEAVAAEWRGQGERVDPGSMPLTRLAFAVLDVASRHRLRLEQEILAYGRSDLLCYRADIPAALAARQNAAWNPLLAWVEDALGVRLNTGSGVAFVAQPPEAEPCFAAALAACDDFALVGLHGAVTITGSLVLGLALLKGRLSAAEAFALSRLDEEFQAEAWGRDAEAEARKARLGADLAATARMFGLMGLASRP